MIKRYQYRCSIKEACGEEEWKALADECRQASKKAIREGNFCNVSFYRYQNMGFLYLEENRDRVSVEEGWAPVNADALMEPLLPVLKPWPEETGDRYFVPMINVYYHHLPGEDIEDWERERTTTPKERIGRVAFVFPEKLPSYVRYHQAIVEEGLLKGDKYAFISLHENLLFSYYEEPRNNVNIKNSEEESVVIGQWMEVDPESHFDRVKAEGSNFLVIPQVFSVDRVDRS